MPRLEVGRTELARAFFAGRYDEVLSQTIDSAAGGAAVEDVAFVVGALSFVGRITEAELLLDGLRNDGSESAHRTRAAGGFFLSVARCRAGNVEGGRDAIVRAERATRGARDAWSRSLLLQGVACCHYFASEFGRAERATTAALKSAQRARFAYAQLLANDMRGHLLLRSGRALEGLSVLERAKRHARALELESNANAIAVSIALAQAAMSQPTRAVGILTAALEATTRPEDGYSRRMLLEQLATYHAWIGDTPRARALLEEAAPAAAGDERAQVSLLTARAHVARVESGWDAARVLAERAAALLPRGTDASRDAEIASLLLGAALASGDDEAADRAADWLTELADQHGLYRAASWLAIYGRRDDLSIAEGDEWTPAMREVTEAAPRTALRRAIRSGLLGLVPHALGREPSRRLVVLDDTLLIEQHGRVERRDPLSPRARELLNAIAHADGRRESLLRVVWGLRTYRPQRHDSVIKTTVSRLRSALGDAGSWIVTRDGGYQLLEGVELVYEDLAAEDSRTDLARSPGPGGRRASRWRRVLDELERSPELTVSELARVLGASVRTMSRDLSHMVAEDIVTRRGAGPATRYRPRPHDEELRS
ncbi:MAG: hypothetical protein AB7S26_15110 [Sandaracinaceae bacterium]